MNKVIEVTENDVKAAFQAAKTDEMKEVLAALFCKREAPTLDNYKTIKSYEDACEALGVPTIKPDMNLPKHVVALMKLETVSKALWGKNFDPMPDPKGEKCYWYPFFALYTKDEIERLNEVQRGALLSAGALWSGCGVRLSGYELSLLACECVHWVPLVPGNRGKGSVFRCSVYRIVG